MPYLSVLTINHDEALYKATLSEFAYYQWRLFDSQWQQLIRIEWKLARMYEFGDITTLEEFLSNFRAL